MHKNLLRHTTSCGPLTGLRLGLICVLFSLIAGCASLAVTTDPSAAPSFASSITWLNDYFRERDIGLRVAEDRVHYDENRAGASGRKSSEFWWYRESRNIYTQYVNGSVLFLSRATVFQRFEVANEAEGLEIMQRLMVLGIKYNKAGRVRPYACLAGEIERCPQYDDDGANRVSNPNTAPCDRRRCPGPR